MSDAPIAQKSGRLWHDYIFLLLIISIGTLLALMQFIHCVHAGRCIFAEDFEVFYLPAQTMALGQHLSPYPLEEAKNWLFENGKNTYFHYSLYPPGSLLLFYPLGFFSSTIALLLWHGLQCVALAAACSTAYARRMLFTSDGAGRCDITTAALLLPFAMLCMLAGQVGILCAALFAFVMAWRDTRPVLAALALAILTLKPQLGLMLPVLLLAERNFRVLLLATGFTLLLQAITVCMWGTHIWRDYFEMLALAPQLLEIAPPQLLTVSLSPTLALRMLQIPAPVCLIAQFIFSLGVVGLVWRALHKADEGRKLWLISTATFLISPYAFQYDAVLLAWTCMMLMTQWMQKSLGTQARIALILLAFLPIVAIKLQVLHIPYGFLAIVIAFIAALKIPKASV